MSLRFVVHHMEYRPERREILLTGTVPDGVLVTGMVARSVGGDVSFSAPVLEIEHFARAVDTEGTRLTFEYDSDEEGNRWRGMEWPGTELSLEM